MRKKNTSLIVIFLFMAFVSENVRVSHTLTYRIRKGNWQNIENMHGINFCIAFIVAAAVYIVLVAGLQVRSH